MERKSGGLKQGGLYLNDLPTFLLLGLVTFYRPCITYG